jgi:hypothetical protein
MLDQEVFIYIAHIPLKPRRQAFKTTNAQEGAVSKIHTFKPQSNGTACIELDAVLAIHG